MRVLITSPSLDGRINVSGISSVVKNIMLCGKSEFRHFLVGKSDARSRRSGWLLDQIRLIARFRSIMLDFRPDIVHVNMPMSPLALIRDGLIVVLSRLWGRRVISHLHGGEYILKEDVSKIFKSYVNFLFSKVETVIVLSEREKTWLLQEFHPRADKIAVLPNAIEAGEGRTLRPRKTNEVPVILFIGRVVSSKGIWIIVEALKVLKDRNATRFQFWLCGMGPNIKDVCDKIADILGDDFHYKGVVSGKKKDDIYRSSDIYLLPSLSVEGLPMALLEAMSYGVLPIVTNVGSMADVVKDHETGLIVPKNSPESLAEKIGELIEWMLKGRVHQMVKNAQSLVINNYSMDRYIDELECLYGEKKY